MISNSLPTDYQTFIATSRYARWLEDEGRRETWPETVTRFMENIVQPHLDDNKDRGSNTDTSGHAFHESFDDCRTSC
jgi:hypothetical protein